MCVCVCVCVCLRVLYLTISLANLRAQGSATLFNEKIDLYCSKFSHFISLPMSIHQPLSSASNNNHLWLKGRHQHQQRGICDRHYVMEMFQMCHKRRDGREAWTNYAGPDTRRGTSLNLVLEMWSKYVKARTRA